MSLVPVSQLEFLPQSKPKWRIRPDYIFVFGCVCFWTIVSTITAFVVPLVLTSPLNIALRAGEVFFLILATFAAITLGGMHFIFGQADWYEASRLGRTKVLLSFIGASIASFIVLHSMFANEVMVITEIGRFVTLIVITTLMFIWFLIIIGEFIK